MICECGGVFNVLHIEESPNNLSKQEKLVYNRLCDVECLKCGKKLYAQPFDFGNTLNVVRETKRGKKN